MVSSSIKSVTFSQEVETKTHAVHELLWMDENDIQAAWYFRKEMAAIQQESRATMNLDAQQSEADTRGLEFVTMEGSRKCLEIVRSILTEQERLKRGDGGGSNSANKNNNLENDNVVMALAEILQKASAHRQRIAYLWGLKDAEVARAYYYADEKDASWNNSSPGGRAGRLLPMAKSRWSSFIESFDGGSLDSVKSSLDASKPSSRGLERRESRRAIRRQRISGQSARTLSLA
jgi:hypothetical protein